MLSTQCTLFGTGVAPFSFTVSLAQGDIIQFAVFSGPDLVDGIFDFTALQFMVTGGGTSISLPSDFPPKPIIFQDYDYSTGMFTPMRFAGNQTVGPNGDITSTGPVYTSQNNFLPYVVLDTARNLFFFHPGTFTTVKQGAVVSAGIPTAGTYSVSGAFARANDFRNAGDGVRVVAFVNNQVGAPLFDAFISADNAVNPNSPFTGTGVAPFSFTVSLAAGDAVQFAVFSGPNLVDGTFDFTALQFTITGGGNCQKPDVQLSLKHYYNQADLPWGPTRYDNYTDAQCAARIAQGSSCTIQRWGCNLTSLAMMLESAAIPAVPQVTPLDLNAFMSATGEFDSNHDVLVSQTALDFGMTYGKGVVFNPINTNSRMDLADALDNGYPVMIGVDLTNGVPGHFVLATGRTCDSADGTYSFSVADPGNRSVRKLDDIVSSQDPILVRGYVSDPVGRSGLYLAASDVVELTVVDSLGRRTGYDRTTQKDIAQIPQVFYSRSVMTDRVSGLKDSAVSHFMDLPNASAGSVFVVVTGIKMSAYSLDITGYSSSGQKQPTLHVVGIAAAGSTATYSIQYSSAQGGKTSSVPVVGDVNGDGIVNCSDISIVQASFGKLVGQPGFDPRADVNLDGVVDVGDLSLVYKNLTPGTQCDSTPPVIIPQIIGTLGNNGWYRSDVAVAWSVSDPESGIASSTNCT